jgi:hypothetical protein
MERGYSIFIDILGFESLADEISTITKLDPAYIREHFMINPLSQKIKSLLNNEDRHYSFTDDHFIVTDYIDKIFRIVKEVSTIQIPLIDPIFIPVEIAVDKKSISADFNPINQTEIIKFLKNDILKNYREYYKFKNNKSIRESFVVITEDMYNNLPTGRNQLCSEINYQNNNYFLANLIMMRDIDGTATNDIIQLKTFKDKISRNQVWNYFEIKTLVYKDEDEQWKSQFIYLKLLENRQPKREDIQTPHCRIVHEIYDIAQFGDILDSLSQRHFSIGDVTVSLEKINNKSKYSFSGIVNNYRILFPANDYGFKEPTYSLIKNGNHSSIGVERIICEELQHHDPPFVSNAPLIDAVKLFGLEFWDYTYMPFIGVFAPLPLQIPSIVLNSNSIEIRIVCSNSINPNFVRVTIAGRIGNNAALPMLSLDNFNRQDSSISLTHYFDNPITGIDGIMMKILYLEDLLDDCYIQKSF